MTDDRLKRLKVRAWRRGTKEMDLLLGPWADAIVEGRAETDLDALEALMLENDQDLYRWVAGSLPAPEAHRDTLAALRAFHGIADPAA